MALQCALCTKDIKQCDIVRVGKDMDVAHEECIQKAMVPRIPVVLVQPVVPPPAAVSAAVFKPIVLGPALCVECHEPAIAMCPCGKYVHQDYGYNGKNCSGRHEGTCHAARQSRTPKSVVEQVKEVIDNIMIDNHPKNGAHKNGAHSNSRKKKGGR